MKLQLATTISDFDAYTDNSLDAIRYTHAAGFSLQDYSFGADFSRRNGFLGNDPEGYLREVLRLADKLGVRFVQAHAPMGRPIVKNEEYEDFMEVNHRCIEYCGKLGIPNIVVHSGYAFDLTKEQCFEQNKEFYNKLLPTAEKYNVNILTENFNIMCVDRVYWVDNARDERELIEYVDHPLFHGCYDTGHGNMNKIPTDEALRILGEHTFALHVQDNFGDDDSHFAPFFGSLSLDALMHGLQEIDYKGYFTFEAGILAPAYKRKNYAADTRLKQAPLHIKIQAEKLLYDIGVCILDAYDAL